MRENFTYGSVRGAAGNGSPYRDRPSRKRACGRVNLSFATTVKSFSDRSQVCVTDVGGTGIIGSHALSTL